MQSQMIKNEKWPIQNPYLASNCWRSLHQSLSLPRGRGKKKEQKPFQLKPFYHENSIQEYQAVSTLGLFHGCFGRRLETQHHPAPPLVQPALLCPWSHWAPEGAKDDWLCTITFPFKWKNDIKNVTLKRDHLKRKAFISQAINLWGIFVSFRGRNALLRLEGFS